MSKTKSEITELLIDLFDKINIQTPSNFAEIRDFIYKDISNRIIIKNVKYNDVAFAFKLWIEK